MMNEIKEEVNTLTMPSKDDNNNDNDEDGYSSNTSTGAILVASRINFNEKIMKAKLKKEVKRSKGDFDFVYTPQDDDSSDDEDDDADDDEDDVTAGTIPYHLAPKSMRRLAKSKPLPAISVSPNRELLIVLHYRKYLTIEDVAAPQVALAGLRFNPDANGVTRRRHYYNMELIDIGGNGNHEKTTNLRGLPPEYSVSFIRWSHDSNYVAFILWSDPDTAHFGSAKFKKKQKELRKLRKQRLRKQEEQIDENLEPVRKGDKPLHQLWVLNAKSGEARRITDLKMGINLCFLSQPYHWLPDNRLLARIISTKRTVEPPKKPPLPMPVVLENLIPGDPSPVRTNPDLLKDDLSVDLFNYYTVSQIAMFYLPEPKRISDASIRCKILNFGPDGPIVSQEPSPDGKYLLTETLVQPYTYSYTYKRFARKWELYHIENVLQAKEIVEPITTDRIELGQNNTYVKVLYNQPIYEKKYVSYDAVVAGPRHFSWRRDVDATLYWYESLDDGNPKAKIPYHDAVFYLPAPFKVLPKTLAVLNGRCSGVDLKGRRIDIEGVRWSAKGFCLVSEMWRRTRRYRLWIVDTSGAIDPETRLPPKRLIQERSYEDLYSDMGKPCLEPYSKNGRYIVQTSKRGNYVFFKGDGASENGARPFLSVIDLRNFKPYVIWRSPSNVNEKVRRVLELDGKLLSENGFSLRLLTEREDPETPPNLIYSVVDCDLSNSNLDVPQSIVTEQMITNIRHPFPLLKHVERKKLKYKRKDGVELSADVYLPVAWTKAEKEGKKVEPLPTVLWAYPKEFKSSKFAAHTNKSVQRFNRLDRVPLYFLCEGYAVLDGPSIPIIGETDEEPNDTFIQQLVWGAEAVINECVRLGITDKSRVACGGHSYGSFMTANLLAHSNLFACGIGRSGAYNRTLTPFGFQREERTLWDNSKLYIDMSPFIHAHKINSPLLLIHGDRDENEGTHPLQSSRMYHALRGLGKVVRFVRLPNEQHSYKAYDTHMHVLWECTQWLNAYCKFKDEHVNNSKNSEQEPVESKL